MSGKTNATIEFTLNTSHNRSEFGFSASSIHIYPYLKAGFYPGLITEMDVAGVRITRLAIAALPGGLPNGIKDYGHTRGRFEFEIADVLSRDESARIIEKAIKQIATYWILTSRNAFYGLPVVALEWNTLHLIVSPSVAAEVSDEPIAVAQHFGMQSTEPVRIPSNDVKDVPSNDLVDLFIDGAHANLPQSKYLIWFSIVEKYVENPTAGDVPFESLFSDDQREMILKFSNQFSMQHQKDAVKGLLLRTKESRASKLCKMLHHLGIATIGQNANRKPITEEFCRKAINYRNASAHAGNSPDETFLFGDFFELCKELVRISDTLTK